MATALVIIDLDALARNYQRLKEAAAPAECGAVVKANAYGLGVEPVAKRLFREGCRQFFVASAAEGLELRALLPEAAIHVFEGAPSGFEAQYVAARLTPVLNTRAQIERWRATRRGADLHIDTGMTRLGLGAADVDWLAAAGDVLEDLELSCVMTHLACADQPEHGLNRVQLERFRAATAKLPAARTSIANSAGVFLGADYRGGLVRPGIALYGGNPFVARPTPVEPVVTLKARVLQLRDVDEAVSVGYGATYVAEPAARLAVLGLGYADGYPRCLGNRGMASVNGARVPIVGRVSMDLLCVDVSDVERDAIEVGQFVELFGHDIGIDEVAAAAGTISYELLTGLGPRLQRQYLGLE